MQEAFAFVIFAVVAVGAVVAVVTFAMSGRDYDRIGRGGMAIGEDEDGRPRHAGTTGGGGAGTAGGTSEAERLDEIRQMLEARNARRRARGEAALDIEAEMAELLRPAIDPALAAEVRELVEARNARRLRRGEEPLDVEAEVARQLRGLEGRA